VGVLILLFCAVPALAAGSPCETSNLMPAFERFLSREHGRSPARKAEDFARVFAPRYPAFYDAKDFGGPDVIEKAGLRFFDPAKRIAFAGFPPLSDGRFIAVAKSIGPDFAAAQRRFLKIFPDFRCRTYVAFGPSFFRFDGHGYLGPDGRERMLFGVDMIAMLHGPEDLPAFFDHELFHLYQDQVAARPRPLETLAAWAMWNEGLATYVSQRMNPSLSAQQVLWFPADLVAKMRPELSRAAGLLLADLGKADEQTYARWFQAGHSAQGLPPRAGYYLGYLFAAEMGKRYALADLPRLPFGTVQACEKSFLRGFVARPRRP
jgi:hypothetical protein